MKHFKFLLINIAAFSFLFFLISLLFPGQVVTSKTVSVNNSKEAIVKKLGDVNDWKKWNAFVRENTVTNNSVYADTLSFSFENNSHDVLNSRFIIYKDATNSVVLNWDMTEKLPWYKPWKKFSAMVLSKQIAATMDSSLNNLKLQIEAQK